jgi:hypothetical protein
MMNKSGAGRIDLLSTLGDSIAENKFEVFWKTYPSCPRKGGKSDCEKRWNRFECDAAFEQIIKHLTWLKTTDQWVKGNGSFIPAPAVFLNQRSWYGAEIPYIV